MRKHLDFYAYCSPNSGIYRIDGKEYFLGEDFRTAKRYREYSDVGFTMLMLQAENSYGGEPFELSACNKCFTEARKAGVKRIVVSDTRLKELCEQKALVGESGQFRDETQFLEYLDFCTSPYRNQSCFYGIQLRDEPTYDMFASYGAVVKGLRKVIPNVYLQCNLLPGTDKAQYGLPDAPGDLAAFETYLNAFADATGLESVTFDEYPFRREYIIGGYSIPGYVKTGKVCAERGLEFRTVLQAFSFFTNGRLQHRRVTESDMYWQTNMAMGFGCREFSFFTYLTKPDFDIGKCSDGVDGAAFINRDGTKTKLWYFTKKIIGQIKRFERVLLRHSYADCSFAFEKGKTYKDFMQTERFDTEPSYASNVTVDKGIVMVTRQKGAKTDLYMIENIGNLRDELFNGAKPVTARMDLTGFRGVKVYNKGKRIFNRIKDNVLSVELKVGDAVFVTVKNKRD